MKHPETRFVETSMPEFLSGGGEMGQRIRQYDWSRTALGDPQSWPQSLRSTISICLKSNFPIAIYWGNDLNLIYNDAWSPIPGDKHPWALGKPAKEVWPEIWNAIGPQFKKAINGEPGGASDALLPMHRHGYTEECYFNFTFTPIYGEGGKVEGVFNAVIETTKTVLNERQLQTLRDLGNLDRTSKTVDEVLATAAKILEKNNKDFPFAIIYKIFEEENKALPISYVGTNDEQIFFPTSITLTAPTNDTENFYKAYSTNSLIVSVNKGRRKNLPKGGWDIEPTHFIHLPIASQSRKTPVAILSAALNPYRQFDGLYHQFVQLVADQISTEVNNVLAYEEERKRAEALAEIDKAKTAFFTNISHEFRTPLTLMLGSLEELLNKQTAEIGDKNKEAIETSHRNAVRMLRLVNNLLDFSRIEAGKVKAQFQLTDICRYTKDLASTFRSVIEHGGLQFHVKCDGFVQPVYVDKEMWEKIVLNLLSNAFKYTLNGSITISLHADNNEAILKVKDTGIGIPEEELPKMFQRFHRAQNVTGRTYEGTGIGLSLVKELVQMHGGKISVRSRLGKGTEFAVSIPTGKHHLPADKIVEKELDFDIALSDAFVEEADSLIMKQAADIANDVSKNAPFVLVVDDNADMRSYIKNILLKSFNVVTASNGMDALLKIKENRFDAIISDVMMPIMDGIQLLKTIKEMPQTATLPVILVSARAGEEAKIEGFDIGADDYLVKPFSAKELIARVRSQIDIAKKRNNALKDIYTLFDEVPFAVAALKGPQLIIEYINQYNLNIWRQSREAVLGRPLFEVRPDIKEVAASLHEGIYPTAKRFEAKEMPIKTLINGKEELRYFNVTIDSMRDEEGKIVGQLAASIDVTDQVIARKIIEESEKKYRELAISLEKIVDEKTADLKRKNEELKTSEERYHKMIDEVEDYAIILLDKNGVVQNWNKGAEKIKGYKEKEIIGKSFSKFYLEEDRKSGLPEKILQEARTSGKALYEGWRLRKDGSRFWGSIVLTALHDHENNIIGFSKVTRDLTRRKLAEDRMQEYTNQLEFKNKELEQFSYAASHDMKEPLRKILFYVSAVTEKLKGRIDEKSKDYLNRSISAAQRMQGLIEDLLVYARTSGSEERFEEVDLAQIVNEIALVHKDDFEQKNVCIETANLKTIIGIPFQLKQLFENLIGNSVKYKHPDRGSIIKIKEETISGSQSAVNGLNAAKQYIHVSVSDNGIGFDPEYSEKIFEIFQRLNNAPGATGSGIGLALCKRIVENHRGIITATGKKNEGARIDIYLPKDRT